MLQRTKLSHWWLMQTPDGKQSWSVLQLVSATHMSLSTSQCVLVGHCELLVQPPAAGTQSPLRQTWFLGQSLLAMQDGLIWMHTPLRHASPIGQSLSSTHLVGGGITQAPL